MWARVVDMVIPDSPAPIRGSVTGVRRPARVGRNTVPPASGTLAASSLRSAAEENPAKMSHTQSSAERVVEANDSTVYTERPAVRQPHRVRAASTWPQLWGGSGAA